MGLCVYIINPSVLTYYILSKDVTSAAWLVLLLFSYMLGYAISSLSKILIKILYFVRYKDINWAEKNVVALAALRRKVVLTASDNDFDISKFEGVMALRNFILSRLNADDNNLTRRFRFISLLNIGIATSIFMSFIILILHDFFRVGEQKFNVSEAVMGALVASLFCDRFLEFNMRTHRLPFEVWDNKLEYPGTVTTNSAQTP